MMIKEKFLFLLLGVILLVTSSCDSTTDSGGDGPDPPPPSEPTPTYNLATSVSPENSGSIDPESGEFEDGTTLSLDAIAETGFAFLRWEGDLSGSENPTNLTMDTDKAVSAVFEDIRSNYAVSLSVSDGLDELILMFGQVSNSEEQSSGAPPTPPAGALNAYFEYNEEKWFEDFRAEVETEVIWELYYQVGEDAEDLILQWEFADGNTEGSLTLISETPEVQVDMLEENSVTLSGASSGVLIIRFER